MPQLKEMRIKVLQKELQEVWESKIRLVNFLRDNFPTALSLWNQKEIDRIVQEQEKRAEERRSQNAVAKV